MDLVCECEMSPSTLEVWMMFKDDGSAHFMQAVSLVAKIFKEHGQTNPVKTLSICPAPLATASTVALDRCKLHSNWDETFLAEQCMIFPSSAMMEEPKPRPATVKALAQGVKAACGSMVPGRQRTCKQSLLGVHMRLPGEDAEVSHGSTSGSDVLSCSSGSESDHRPAFVHNLLTNHTSSGRETRLTPWGHILFQNGSI